MALQPMIIIVETTWTGLHHAPANVSLLRTVAHALPHEPLHFFAEGLHLAEVKRCWGEDYPLKLVTHAIALPPLDAPPLFRLRWETALLKRAIVEVDDDGGPCLIVIAAATGTNISAANLVALRLGRRRFYFHHRLHGNLNELHGWRSRNPLLRAIDLRSALTKWDTPRARYIVLEPHIRENLTALLPNLHERIDVVPETIDPRVPWPADPAPPPPIRIGYLGLGTIAKGFDLYLRLARELAPELQGAVEFHAIGNLHRDLAKEDQRVLAAALAERPISRQEFVKAAARLHYVVLPYRGSYYQWSASGTLVDAISLGKPIISTPFPFVEDLFKPFGDVGFLCSGEPELAAVFRGLPASFALRYPKQKQAMTAARQDRHLSAAIAPYRQGIGASFPAVLYGLRADNAAMMRSLCDPDIRRKL